MALEFDINNTNKNNIELLNCQVDLILKSLEFYSYTYQYIYPRSQKNKTKEENLRISLVTDTYEQILNQYVNSNNVKANNNFCKTKDKFFKNIA